jgi:hypothetical protein
MSADLLALVRGRHTHDVYVEECKDGPTWGGTHFRLDAWAMKRSWSRPCFYGYEVKRSRRDFLKDEKWPGYLKLCNVLYFVAPRDVVRPEELPAEVGLLSPSQTGTVLYTRKKAPHRTIEPPVDLLLYLLMCRTWIVDGHLGNLLWGLEKLPRSERARAWARWLEDQEDASAVGRSIGEIVAKRTAARCKEVMEKNERLEDEMAPCQNLRRVFDDLKLDPSTWAGQKAAEAQVRALARQFLPGDLESLRMAHCRLGQILSRMEEGGA